VSTRRPVRMSEVEVVKSGLVLYAWWWISFLHTLLYLSSLLAGGLPSSVSIILIYTIIVYHRLYDLLLLPHACISIRGEARVSKAVMCHVRGGFHTSKGRWGLARNNKKTNHFKQGAKAVYLTLLKEHVAGWVINSLSYRTIHCSVMLLSYRTRELFQKRNYFNKAFVAALLVKKIFARPDNRDCATI
jgi:hypothetical protein